MQHYEWKVEGGLGSSEDLEIALNALDEEGWEIFALMPGREDTTRIIARRPCPASP